MLPALSRTWRSSRSRKALTKSAQVLQLFTGEVVLAVGAAGPGGQAHVGLVGISAGGGRGGLAVDGVVKLVLDGGALTGLIGPH